MTISVSVELCNLSEEGIFEAAKVALQGAELEKCDWKITGSVIENMGLKIEYSPPRGDDDVRTLLHQNEFWEVTRQGEFLPETGKTPHHALAKAVVARAMVNERLALSVESAIRWVGDNWIFVDTIRSESHHHQLTDLGLNRFSIRAREGIANLEHFQNIVLLVEAVADEYLKEIRRTIDTQTGAVSALELEEK